MEYLRSQKVKYSAINIGPINKRDIMKASTMLEHNEKYGVVLGFDVPVTRDAQELADSFKPPIKVNLFFQKYSLVHLNYNIRKK